MKIRLRSVRNVVRDTWRRHPLFVAGLCLLGCLLFATVYLVFLLFFTFAAHQNSLSEMVYQLTYFLFLFLLAGAVPFVASTLLHSGDYDLLFAAPLPARTIIAAKLLEATVTNSLQFTVLGIPVLVACATALRLPLLGWLTMPLLILLFALLPALLTALGLLLALRLLGMHRLRSAIGLVNALMATFACVTIVLESGHLPLLATDLSAAFTAVQPYTSSSPTAHLLPSGWFAGALLAMSSGALRTATGHWAAIGLVVGGLYTACMGLGSSLLSAANLAEESSRRSPATPPLGVAGKTPRVRRRLLAAPIAAFLRKDLRYLLRDSILLSQLAMPLILFLIPFLLTLRHPILRQRDEMHPFVVAIISVIVFMQTSILSLSSIGLESRSFWIAQTSPNRGRALLTAKFLFSTLVSAGCGLTLTAISGVAFHLARSFLALQAMMVLLCTMALCGLGVGISAALPRFLYENPAHRVSAWALILGFFTSAAYLTSTLLLFGIAWYLTTQPALADHTTAVYVAAFALYLALTVISALVPMAIGVRRIDQYQWEH